MRIAVKVKPNSRQEKVDRINDTNFVVYVKEKPQEGKATKAAIKLLAGYFDVPKSSVTLVIGQTSRQKIFDIKQ